MLEKLFSIASIKVVYDDCFILFWSVLGLTKVGLNFQAWFLVFESVVSAKVPVEEEMLLDETDELFVFGLEVLIAFVFFVGQR